MSRSLGVLSALHGPDELGFVTAVDALAPAVVLARRCGDVAELLAAAHAGLGRVAVVSADLPGLDRDVVANLHDAGVRTVAIADPPEGWLAERTRALGIAIVVSPTDAVSAVSAEAERVSAGTADESVQLASTSSPGRAADDAVEPATNLPATGSLLAVWGPTGAPGRTTIAVNLAAELAALTAEDEGEVVLVDADTYGGTVGQVLGLLDEAPGIAAAARAAGHGTLDRAALALLAPVVAPRLRVVTGISRAARWAEVPGPSLDTVWDTARTLGPWTVVDCGFGIEDDEALSYDTRAPRRNAATLSVLAAADLVVVVGAADPIGVQRLVRSLAELDGLGVAASRVVVANRVRSSAVGPRPAELVGAALERYAGVGDVRFVPDDRQALDAAVLRGLALREVAAGSPARKAIATLAADLAAVRTEQLRDASGAPARRRAARRAAARS